MEVLGVCILADDSSYRITKGHLSIPRDKFDQVRRIRVFEGVGKVDIIDVQNNPDIQISLPSTVNILTLIDNSISEITLPTTINSITINNTKLKNILDFTGFGKKIEVIEDTEKSKYPHPLISLTTHPTMDSYCSGSIGCKSV